MVSRAGEFLANAVAGAQLLSEGAQVRKWRGSCIELNFTDPLASETTPSSESDGAAGRKNPAPAPAALAPAAPASADLGSIPTINLQVELDDKHPSQEACIPEPTFGAVLAEVFLILSVLSKQDGPARLPPISTLHHHPVLGSGKSSTVRLVPSSSFGNHLKDVRGEENVVFKSLRHRETVDSERPGGDERLHRIQNFLRELRVLTHGPLRNHENIVRLLGVGWERNRLSMRTSVFHWPFLVLEHAQYGSLTDFLEDNAADFDTRNALCLDVGTGLQMLHRCDVIHGDMKPENVLVFSHPGRKYVAKIADFGFTSFDLEGKLPTTHRVGYTRPWEAPESSQSLAFRDRQSTDTYSYGFLIWRCLSYGHYPFNEANGSISTRSLKTIKQLKETDGVPHFASELLRNILEEPLLSGVALALEKTIKLSLAARSLEEALNSLALAGTLQSNRSRSFAKPIRSTEIPSEQGLGIYAYGSRDLRLDKLNLDALESHYLYARLLGESISASSHLLLQHGSSTLSGDYLERHFSGDTNALTHPTPTMKSGFFFLQVSAGAQSGASAEAIVPMAKAFDCDSLILDVEQLSEPAAYVLYRGSEFILRDVTLSEVPGKAEFFNRWTVRRCRGVGIGLSIPKDVFDGTGARYHEFLSKPFCFDSNPDEACPHRVIDADFLLRIAAGWGSPEDVRLLIKDYGADSNSRDAHGETALLKACRAGHLDVVRYLVTEAGALANIGSHKNVTPLHWLSSFPTESIKDVAKQLYSANGDPNAIITEEFGGPEGEYWFFKGPPLMRAVASGNVQAVDALLDIGADPLISRIGTPLENPLVFAVRRARLDVMKALIRGIDADILWRREFSGYRIIYNLISASPVYLAKIHLDKFEEALVETFDHLWSLADTEKRQFLSIDARGRIPIQVAVANGSFPLVKRIVEFCPSIGHLKELVVTIGMQTAIVEGRYAMFKYLLDNGGLALHPVLDLDPEEDSQFEIYVTCGPWTQHLIGNQRKTTSLHLCARAGEYAQKMCEDLLRSILPASRWARTPEILRRQNIVNCSCNRPLEIDPLVDCRNELSETPFFCALQAEEYQMAFSLYQAGASQNVSVPHQIVSRNGPYVPFDDNEGLPLAEHALTWTSAYMALHFIIRLCWGCLRLTSQHGDELRLCVIEETASWPFEEASELFEYIEERCYPGYQWDKQILHAIKWRNQAVVNVILPKRKQLIPSHSQPHLLYDAVRAGLLIVWKKPMLERAEGARRLTNILQMIKRHFPEHPFGGHGSLEFGETAINALTPEISRRKERYSKGLISLHKLEGELNGLLFPWLVCMICEREPDRTQPLVAFGMAMQRIFENNATVQVDTDPCWISLTARNRRSVSLGPNDSAPAPLDEPRENGHERSIFKRKSLSLLSKILNGRKS